jgi:hypothetical protein
MSSIPQASPSPIPIVVIALCCLPVKRGTMCPLISAFWKCTIKEP